MSHTLMEVRPGGWRFLFATCCINGQQRLDPSATHLLAKKPSVQLFPRLPQLL